MGITENNSKIVKFGSVAILPIMVVSLGPKVIFLIHEYPLAGHITIWDKRIFLEDRNLLK